MMSLQVSARPFCSNDRAFVVADQLKQSVGNLGTWIVRNLRSGFLVETLVIFFALWMLLIGLPDMLS